MPNESTPYFLPKSPLSVYSTIDNYITLVKGKNIIICDIFKHLINRLLCIQDIAGWHISYLPPFLRIIICKIFKNINC